LPCPFTAGHPDGKHDREIDDDYYKLGHFRFP